MNRIDLLRGIGYGMVFAMVVVFVSPKKTQQLTDEQIKARALKLGMIEKEAAYDQVVSQSPTPEIVVVTGASISEQPEETNKIDVVVATENNNEKSETKTPETKTPATKKATDEPKATKKPNVDKSYVTVEIKAGMWSEEIAKKFYELQLVENAETFDKFLCNNGYGSKIKDGTYKIPKGASYKEIAEIITQ